MPLFGSGRRRERSRDHNSRDRRHITSGRDIEAELARLYARYDGARFPSHPTELPPRDRSPRLYGGAADVDLGSDSGRAILGSQYVAGLPLRRPSQLPSNRQTCGTCLEDFADEQDGVAIVQLPCCQNSIHRECILLWVGESQANNNTCPFCRHELFTRSHYNGRGANVDYDLDYAAENLRHSLRPSLDLPTHHAGVDDHLLRLADIRRQGALRDRRPY